MTWAYGETVTLHLNQVTGQDVYGNDVYTATDVVVDGAVFAPSTSQELLQGEDLVMSHPAVYLQGEYDLTAVDAVTVRGVKYLVDGVPNVWRNPITGWRPGMEIRLQGVTG